MIEEIILTNMCMIYDRKNDRILVENRIKSWPGIAFPGGHVEKGEAIVPSTIREVKEETGLDITDLQLVGIHNWYDEQANERTIVFLFKTEVFSGTLIDHMEEGDVFWVPRSELMQQPFAAGFQEQIIIFDDPSINEIFCTSQDKWKNIFY